MLNEPRHHHVIDSRYGSLRMTEPEFFAYEKDMRAIHKKYYLKERNSQGIWASNQGKYVLSRGELNQFDSKFMEDNYA